MWDHADALTMKRAEESMAMTVITVASSLGAQKFVERGFTGCGRVWFSLPKSEWRLAKTLGFKKGYRDWSYGGDYYNGQFGEACHQYSRALSEFQKLYPGSVLDKVSTDSYID